ncbi:hypothetical protein THAOC_24800 [Thalassiosira oceanica]|uniref:START domain-containing protein n=1 Tax=Thalassiosira oceanica TaxID=159749 RepID=K0RNV7_THAOC|nr:hypothetical protein THAOC_24800 [Thalassiosira oceanica]|eukprot:EJK55468.1 hypothetical protein THAOC_24800 [Thalassiosira oceanica]
MTECIRVGDVKSAAHDHHCFRSRDGEVEGAAVSLGRQSSSTRGMTRPHDTVSRSGRRRQQGSRNNSVKSGPSQFTFILVCILCRSPAEASSVSVEPKRRRNNTGFYFGIRDDDICRAPRAPDASTRPDDWTARLHEGLDRLVNRSEQPIASLNARQGSLLGHFQEGLGQFSSGSQQAVGGQTDSPTHDWAAKLQGGFNQLINGDGLPNSQEDTRQTSPFHQLQEGLSQFISGDDRHQSPSPPDVDQHRSRGTLGEVTSRTLSKCKSLLQDSCQPTNFRSAIAESISHSLRPMHHIAQPQPGQFTMLDKATSLIGGSLITAPPPGKRRKNNTGFYYGIREDVLLSPPRPRRDIRKDVPSRQLKKKPRETKPSQDKKGNPRAQLRPNNKRSKSSDGMDETLAELREMRAEMAALREELKAVKERLRVDGSVVELDRSSSSESEDDAKADLKVNHGARRRARHRRLEQVGREVEAWATELLDAEDRTADGWKEIQCNKLMRNKCNKNGRTSVYLKDVCAFLADSRTVPQYNDLVVDHADVEEISPSGKVTWCKAPQILFVKPRDFVTYCSHRWRGDGSQVLVNQAVDHEDRPGVIKEGQGNVGVCRGFAIRGANIISRDPDDPRGKTRISMVSHATPGGGLPSWAMNRAVDAVVRVEPFKFFHKIDEGAKAYKSGEGGVMLARSGGRSNKPAGIGHLGFTCFWPEGGGLQEHSGSDGEDFQGG